MGFSFISKTEIELVGIVLDRIIGSSDPEVHVNQVRDLSSMKETVFFVSLHFLQTDSSSEVRIIDDFVQR